MPAANNKNGFRFVNEAVATLKAGHERAPVSTVPIFCTHAPSKSVIILGSMQAVTAEKILEWRGDSLHKRKGSNFGQVGHTTKRHPENRGGKARAAS